MSSAFHVTVGTSYGKLSLTGYLIPFLQFLITETAGSVKQYITFKQAY